MAFLEFKNIRVAGISAGVPSQIASNLTPSEEDSVSSDYSPEDFVKTTGVEERRVSGQLCASDLGVPAAEKLISDLNWDKSEIMAVIFVSQSADYILPATSCIIQDRLGLSTECYALDSTLGCSGWVYGLTQVAGLLNAGTIKKALLFVGEGRKRVPGKRDPLFGSATAVTALEYSENAPSLKFHLATDGSGYDAIITPDGGSRNQITEDSFKLYEFEGKFYHRLQTRMKGMDVFSFGISQAPKSVKKLAEHYDFDYHDADYFVFHQANMKMNNLIAKKLKLDKDQVPSSMRYFGNTNGASIPVTIVTQLKNRSKVPTKYVCCGFGVGLSWGTVSFETDENFIISDLVEVDEPKEKSKWV